MYVNLRNLLNKRGISTKQYGQYLGVSEKTAYNKLEGITELTLNEAIKTRVMLPEYSFEYIFEESDKEEIAQAMDLSGREVEAAVSTGRESTGNE